jgi:hypothetical protein
MKECCSEKTRTVLAYFVGVIGSFLILAVLSLLVVRSGGDDMEADRAEARHRARTEIQVASKAELERFAIDPNKVDLAKLSVDRAIELIVEEWRDSSAEGREKLLQRLEDSKELMSFE